MLPSDIKPVLVAPVTVAQGSRLPEKEIKPNIGAPQEVSKSIKAEVLPKSLCDVCQNTSLMGFMVEGLSAAATTCSRVGEGGTAPYLNASVAPLFFVHTVVKVKNRLKLAIEAAKVSASDAVLHIIQAIDAFGGAVGNLGQSTNAVAQLTSLTQYAVVGLIFSYILPRFLLATTSLGMVAGVWALMRNHYALAEYNKKKGEGAAQAIAFLMGHKIHKDETDAVAQDVLKREKEVAKESHFLSGTFDTSKAKKFFQTLDLKAHLDIAHKAIQNQGLSQVEQLIHDLIASDKSDAQLLHDTLAIFETIEQTVAPKGLEGFFQEVISKKAEFNRLSRDFLALAETDIRNELFNQAFTLLILTLVISAQSISIANPKDPFVPSILSIAASVCVMGSIIHSGFISYKSQKELEEFLNQDT